ncbi:MAG: GntR family transcriptional regulator [Actinomycetota bacterium]
MRYLDLAEAVRARIATGTVGPSGALPSEAELARAHGTSRVTVRRALDALRREGLVTSRRGAGWFVALDPVRQPLGRVTTVEAAVEAAGAVPGRRILAFEFVTASATVADALEIDTGVDVLRVVRVNLADGEPFALVTVWVRAEFGVDLSRSDVERAPFYDLLPVRGVELATVHQTITADVADARTASRLDIAAGAPILVGRRLTRDADGCPILYSEHRYPAARTNFEIEFSLTNANTGVMQHG